MKQKTRRFSIRTQLTVIVLVAALLSTIATLFIANSAIQNYVIDQTKQREVLNLQVAWLVLHTQFGDNVSIGVDGQLVADSPLVASGSGLGVNALQPYSLKADLNYVDEVQHLVGGVVAIYQCADSQGDLLASGCPRISTTILEIKHGQTVRNLDDELGASVLQYVERHPTTPRVERDTVSGDQYIAAYQAILSPQQEFIGVLFVGEPLSGVQDLISRITLELSIVGGLIMVIGALVALFLAHTITGTLQHASRQVSSASTKFGTIAAHQLHGSAQQIWAIDALAQGLRNLSETAGDIAKSLEQLTQMGMQILQHQGEISPAQMSAIISYMTRSTRAMGVQSSKQTSMIDRMSGAMHAVTEIAQQVARDSQETTAGTERLALVVNQLQRLVGASDLLEVRRGRKLMTLDPASVNGGRERKTDEGIELLTSLNLAGPNPAEPFHQLPRSVRPSQANRHSGASDVWPPITSPPTSQ